MLRFRKACNGCSLYFLASLISLFIRLNLYSILLGLLSGRATLKPKLQSVESTQKREDVEDLGDNTEDNIREWLDCSIAESMRIVSNRERWRRKVETARRDENGNAR